MTMTGKASNIPRAGIAAGFTATRTGHLDGASREEELTDVFAPVHRIWLNARPGTGGATTPPTVVVPPEQGSYR